LSPFLQLTQRPPSIEPSLPHRILFPGTPSGCYSRCRTSIAIPSVAFRRAPSPPQSLDLTSWSTIFLTQFFPPYNNRIVYPFFPQIFRKFPPGILFLPVCVFFYKGGPFFHFPLFLMEIQKTLPHLIPRGGLLCSPTPPPIVIGFFLRGAPNTPRYGSGKLIVRSAGLFSKGKHGP